MRASEIRELLKLTEQPDIISFAGGLPNPKCFPYNEIKEIIGDVIKKDGERALQYSTTEGVVKLREDLIEIMRKDGIKAELEDTLITTGSQQGLDLIGRIFIDPGDEIIVGAPTYLGGCNAYRFYLAKFEPIKLDDDGLSPELIEERIKKVNKKGRRVKFIYTIPTFQNPSGITMPETRRKKIIDIANEYDVIIVEDDPYSKLRYEGKHIKPIKAFDDIGRVVYLGTFSKLLAPGFRIGWAIGQKDIIRKMVLAKQGTDLCTPAFTQYIAHKFIEHGFFYKHIEKIKATYKKKRNIMLSSMEKYFPNCVKWTKSEGGLFTWAVCPEDIDTDELLVDAVKERVAYVSGKAFFVDGSGQNTMRLNFSHPADEKIEEGVKRLGKVIKEKTEKIKYCCTTPQEICVK
ncbi:MAG: PLP-dependent aminotransferase family protein [Candidatus Thermoplasmatota archaeon]